MIDYKTFLFLFCFNSTWVLLTLYTAFYISLQTSLNSGEIKMFHVYYQKSYLQVGLNTFSSLYI